MSFDTARAMFQQVDTNNDGSIDQSEFAKWVSAGVGGVGGGFSSSSSTSTGGQWLEGSSSGYGVSGSGGASFDQVDANHNGSIDRSEFSQWSASGMNAGGASSSSSSASAAAAAAACGVQKYQVDSRGYFIDPSPLTETRPNPNTAPTYTQNIRVSFLQPPPVPQPNPRVIREVRPPPPPPPAPFRTRVEPPAPPQPPPLVLREQPPPRPPVVNIPPVTVTVPAFPAPPRSVITERFAPLPPRPRDIILERWIPYGPTSQPRTVRIPAPCGPLPAVPRNRIIQYTALQARVVRQFQRLGVTQADPEAYRRQHGAILLDSASFLQQARAAGVVEDITPPGGNLSGAMQLGVSGGDASSVSGAWGTGVSGVSGESSSVSGSWGTGISGESSSVSGSWGTGEISGGGYSEYSSSGQISGSTGFDVAGASSDGTVHSSEFSSFSSQGL